MKDNGCIPKAEAASSDSGVEEDLDPLYCWDCNVSFTSKQYLYSHLIHHVKQPFIHIKKVTLPPLKITLKNRSGNSFEIISNSPSSSPVLQETTSLNLDGSGESKIKEEAPEEVDQESTGAVISEVVEEEPSSVSFSPNFVVNGVDTAESPASSITENTTVEEPPSSLSTPLEEPTTPPSITELSIPLEEPTTPSSVVETADKIAAAIIAPSTPEYGGIPGAEPTPPPEPSPDYPKIRIKTTGLLKESLTITEITDDNPNGDSQGHHMDNNNSHNMWNSGNSMEDPLKLPDDDNNLMTLFNNNERAKDLGFTTSDSEFISLDRLDDRNRGAMQLYNPNSVSTQNSIESLTGLPMQQLAQQVSRLQPNGNNGMHQQNVLINIQQFPQAPPQPTYQPPPMYHHPPHPQPMYQPYQPYQPPNPYYPQPPSYPPQHMPPPPNPQMNQMGQPPMNQHQMNQGQNQIGQPPLGQNQIMPANQHQNMPPQMQQNMQPPQNNYRPQMQAPRQNGPRHPPPPGQRPQAPRQPMPPRTQMSQRQRAPLIRPRGSMQPSRGGMRPRMAGPNQNGVRPQSSPIKRTPEQQQAMQAKKKKLDMFTDRDDDDCQVICMQPKNTDGGLPQIESVQGGQSEPAENSIMHLSDSITLSVRNPPPKPVEVPKKSDAKAVANVLASRGITVTATAKPKEKENNNSSLSSSLNLNGAVSIIPAAKNNKNESQLPTVDLTDDVPEPKSSLQKGNRPGLPFKCDLCPAQYPNAVGLGKHRQNFHKTSNGMPELGIPLINLKQPGIMQKLSSLGIVSYIPLPASGADGTFAIPVINSRNPGNVSALGANSMITLGPVKHIPKPVNNVNSPMKQMTQK